MAKQTLIWTVLPNGQQADGRWRVAIVASPRLTPQTSGERLLGSSPEWADWADWPATLSRLRFELEIGAGSVPLIPVTAADTAPDSALWKHLFPPSLPVATFNFKNMAQVNLRSFPIRQVMGFVRRQYQNLSLKAGSEDHPTLLPWNAADPVLKGMLGELGTRTVKQTFGERVIELPLPGFNRFHTRSDNDDGTRPHDKRIDAAVFNPTSCIKAPARKSGRKGETVVFNLRALPPVWEDPVLIRNGSIQVAPADREKRAQLMEQFSGPTEYAMWQADRFYNRTVASQAQRQMKRPGFVGGTAALVAPEYDFHQRIASYGDHANLLRRLGLVLDCVLERNTLLDALLTASPGGAVGFMRLKLIRTPARPAAGDLFPTSAWQARGRRFVMQPRTPDHAGGLLKLDRANDRYAQGNETSPFDLYQVDPDGAALKTVNFLLTAQNLVGKSLQLGADGAVTYTTGDRQPVATLRSGGIGVSRHGRAGQVAMSAASASLNNTALAAGGAAAAEVLLFAEDVLRGYRVDVQKGVDRWRSLCARTGQYTALARADGTPARPIKLPPDEGCVKGASTTSAEDKPADHYLHETLFRWSGWSLAAPRPGRTLRDTAVAGTNMQTEEVVEPPELAGAAGAAPKGSGLAVRFDATKHSLPKLRFGASYRLRARLVDLAGNSLVLDDRSLPDDEQASEALRYGRFEPVDPPPLVLQRRLSEGESLERLVLRSNFDRTANNYAADIAGPLAGFYNNQDFEYGAPCTRHVVPPKSSQQQCEQHGMFDAAIGSSDPARIKAAYAIAALESGSLLAPVPGAAIELITPAKAGLAATVQGAGAMILPPEQADNTRDRFAAGQYLVHREAIVPMPYLPDPACGGIALQGVPGLERWVDGKPLVDLAPGLQGYVLDKGARAVFANKNKARLILLLDFDRDPGDDPGPDLQNDWPHDVRSLRIELYDQPAEVTKPPCGDEHTLANPPKWDFDQGVLALFLPKGHIARLRYASFMHDKLVGHFGLPRWHDGAQTLQLQAEAMAGCNWMLTPWRALTLVHATQQPVCEPWLEHASLLRDAGAQHADLNARLVHLHGPSTGHFEIVAEWHEWIDDPLADRAAAPGPQRVKHSAQLAQIRLGENHANLFRLIDVVRAQTQFKPVGGQVQPTDLAKRPALPGNRHEFGDTRFRFVQYRLRASTRFREYLPPGLFDKADLITRLGPVVETERMQVLALPALGEDDDAGAPVLQVNSGGRPGTLVPASMPPEVPELIYVVPTFRWQRPAPQGNTRSSVRLGNGLRVYLDRPWFSSGDGELLGVVITGDNVPFDQITAERLPLVTQWGQDPLWDSGLANTRARVEDFPAAVRSEMALLQEDSTGVQVVGHRVHFDAARKLWYCDIEINPGAGYTPFVRLALVRYQPNALAGAKISRVVLAEFAQVLPRRRAVLVRDGARVEANVYGPASLRGPLRRFNPGGAAESEYANLSLSQPGGPDGRNRMELVLQVQDEGVDSDLGWDDLTQLASGLVGGAANTRSASAPLPEGVHVQRSDDSVKLRTRRGDTLRLDRLVQRDSLGHVVVQPGLGSGLGGGLAGGGGGGGGAVIVQPPVFAEPAVWTQVAQLPRLPNGRALRLVLREFERFYTDRTVPEPVGSSVGRRVVVEERLVYAEVFLLD